MRSVALNFLWSILLLSGQKKTRGKKLVMIDHMKKTLIKKASSSSVKLTTKYRQIIYLCCDNFLSGANRMQFHHC
jgi:hypothetical protein